MNKRYKTLNNYILPKDGMDLFDYQWALSLLLMNEVIDVSPNRGLNVNLSDVFYDACADFEEICISEIKDLKDLYSLFLKSRHYCGVTGYFNEEFEIIKAF
jgi:hypothetical protein